MFLEPTQELIIKGFNDVCARNREFLRDADIRVENHYIGYKNFKFLQNIETIYSFIITDYSIIPKIEMEFSGVGVILKHETIDVWGRPTDMSVKVKGWAYLREGLV